MARIFYWVGRGGGGYRFHRVNECKYKEIVASGEVRGDRSGHWWRGSALIRRGGKGEIWDKLGTPTR